MIELREYVSVDKGLVVDYVSNFNKFKVHLMVFLLLLLGYLVIKFLNKCLIKVGKLKVVDRYVCLFIVGLIYICSALFVVNLAEAKFIDHKTITTRATDVYVNKDIDTSKYIIKFSDDRKYLVLDSKGNNIKFTYKETSDSSETSIDSTILEVKDEVGDLYIVDYVKSNGVHELATIPKDSFKVSE